MAGETTLTLVGNLVADPELRYTQSGTAVANFRVASTPRRYDSQARDWVEGDPLFMSCHVWREMAENVAETLKKGMRVVVVGRLAQREYETKEGEQRRVIELDVDEVGPALRFATAVVTPAGKRGGGGYNGSGGGNPGGFGSPDPDPWSGSAKSTDEPPF